MSKTVLIRFVTPPPITVKTGKATSHTRHWNGDKLTRFVQEHLEIGLADTFGDIDIKVVASSQAEIRFDGWKPEGPDQLRQVIGEIMAEALAHIDPEDYLQA